MLFLYYLNPPSLSSGRKTRSRNIVHFNFLSEVKEDQKPDSKSPTLRNYHKLLWSKPLNKNTHT